MEEETTVEAPVEEKEEGTEEVKGADEADEKLPPEEKVSEDEGIID